MPFSFEIASGYLYFSDPGLRDQFDNHDGNGRILRRQLDGSELETIAEAEAEPAGLAVDATHVYWFEAGAIREAATLWRAPIDGSGQPKRLLTTDLAPWPEALKTLRITADKIYWKATCTLDGGQTSEDFILGMAKP